MGPVTTAGAYANYERYSEQLHADGGKVLAGANVLRDGDLVNEPHTVEDQFPDGCDLPVVFG